MTTTIHITLEADSTGVLVLERQDLATVLPLSLADDPMGSQSHMLYTAIMKALENIEPIIQNPPPEVTIPEPAKPAPAPSKPKASPAKKTMPAPATTKPAASVATPPPPPKPARWWTNEDDGKVIRDDAVENKPGYSGPYSSQPEAEQNVPAWLKPAFKSKPVKK